jgi:HK97 family phage major capsid protein
MPQDNGARDIRAKLDEVRDEIAALEPKVQEKWLAFEEKRNAFAQAGEDANTTNSPAFAEATEVHKEYATAAQELEEKRDFQSRLFELIATDKPAEAAAAAKADAAPGERRDPRSAKSLGQIAQESEGYKQLVASGVLKDGSRRTFNEQLAETDRDTLMAALITGGSATSAGAFVLPDEKGYVPQPRRQPRLFDLITVGATDSDTVHYVRQTTFTNVAAETAEAETVDMGTKPEATLAFEEVSESVRTIAHWIPATRQALADAAQMRTLIDSQLRYGLEFRLEGQIVSGAGTSGTLKGILNQTGILTQAKSTDSVADAIHKAITQIRLGFLEPNGIAMHPTDWELLRLARDGSGGSATTGAYLWGPPSTVGPQTVWWLPTVVTAAIPDDTSVVADWRYATLWIREGVQILASDSHDDFFIKNLVAVLAEMRAAFGLTLPQAFAKVTGVD